jgi:hypothetical protein
MIIVENKRTRGRPRAFDEEAALGDAMRVFWAEGYEATTIPMLTEAMGISAQSLLLQPSAQKRRFTVKHLRSTW